ncbi:hypothetical protein Bca52824_014897 [Brassica carinata]|uniref:Uncharacterized protein n=1 Tax=Brassica carinata TaxID=52824 RepID=A0A8X8B2Q6_BRACI|nr:hypothetical protein Bca52824_014897 [Brassica carinata]
MLSHNFFSSFENVSQESTDIHRLDLNSNSLRGPFPDWVCKFSRLEYLDLSNNLFSGSIPSCLSRFTYFLMELTLGNNNFSGTLPDIFGDATSNKFKDKFPHWLGSLPSLHVLSLRCNKFFGPLYRRHMSSGFKSSVPRGTQFQSQNCSSFMDNPELLGLEDICRKPNVLGPTSHQPEEVSESEEPMFNWVAAAIAYGPGVFCGFVIGYYIFTSGYHEWFAERFGRRKIRVVTSVR